MVQLSTNSNKQIEWLVAAQPTPIGRHRTAYLQAMDRHQALTKAQMEIKKLQARVKVKQAEIDVQRQSMDQAAAAGDLASASFFEARIELLELEKEEMQQGMEFLPLQIADAERELKCAKRLMAEACQEAGLDFEKLDEATYQHLLGENVRLTTGRRLSAKMLATVLGFPPEVVETIIELPPAEREMLFSQYQYQLQAVNTAAAGILNPITNRQVEGASSYAY